jgi:hypothetical protein
METLALEIDSMTQPIEAHHAYERVDALLRAYGFSHSSIRSRHCLRFVDEALQHCPLQQDQLESIAARSALNAIQQGIEQTMDAVGIPIQTVTTEDFYLALQATNIPQDHPNVILRGDTPDAALCLRIRNNYESQAKPSLRRISMGAPSLRFDAIDEVADSAERFLKRYPLLLNALKFSIIGASLYLVYIIAR